MPCRIGISGLLIRKTRGRIVFIDRASARSSKTLLLIVSAGDGAGDCELPEDALLILSIFSVSPVIYPL